jgi:hypothetical protein
MQDFSVGATGSSVTRGNMAVLRCIVPSFVRDFLSVTSWLQDQKFNIYPSSDGGKHYFKYYSVLNRSVSVSVYSSEGHTCKHKSRTGAIFYLSTLISLSPTENPYLREVILLLFGKTKLLSKHRFKYTYIIYRDRAATVTRRYFELSAAQIV